MIITEVRIEGFRNLDQLELEPAAEFNLVAGPNGIGKSSLLEAIQCLSTGHSFRTRRARELVSHETERFLLSAGIFDPQLDQQHRIGLARYRDGRTELRLDHMEQRSVAPMSRLLPVKALTPDSHVLIQDGPQERRAFIDWGCFHEHEQFHVKWREYRRALAQRNETLRRGCPEAEVVAWDDTLAECGAQLDTFRRQWLERLSVTLQPELAALGSDQEIRFHYRGGWADSLSLAEALAANLDTHRRMRTTTDGPHRAELVIQAGGHAAREVLSRGQQKTLVYALHLAQLSLLNQTARRKAVVLCDDLAAELDPAHQDRLLERLQAQGGQVFVAVVSDGRELPVMVERFGMKVLGFT